jgi:NAD(P)-dependent dehydrogenase (short-subunit alcohol dehydrogenase family)
VSPTNNRTKSASKDAATESSPSRVALVTGASSGIGRAIALGLAEDGFGVICCDLVREPREDGFEEESAPTDQLITASGVQSCFLPTDVSREDDVERAFSVGIQTMGRLDAVVNNAGIAQDYAAIDMMTYEAFQRVMTVNVEGVWLCCREAVRCFIGGSSGGSIINIASIAGLIGFPEETGYCASKAAVLGLTRSLSLEVASWGVTVNAVCPGYIQTGHLRALEQATGHREAARSWDEFERATPLRRLGDPSDVANAVRFLASARSGWITGSVLVVDGGFTAR